LRTRDEAEKWLDGHRGLSADPQRQDGRTGFTGS